VLGWAGLGWAGKGGSEMEFWRGFRRGVFICDVLLVVLLRVGVGMRGLESDTTSSE
jgi:hypothetical protein